jgi:hypothetical protein
MAETVIARLSGVVTYTDGSNAHFAAHLDQRGNISYNGSTGKSTSKTSIRDIDLNNNWLDLMFAQLPSITFSTSGSGTGKTVSGLNAELSGRVTVASPTAGHPHWEDFIVQFTSKTGDSGVLGQSIPEGGTTVGSDDTSAWVKAKATAALMASLNAMFDTLGITVS